MSIIINKVNNIIHKVFSPRSKEHKTNEPNSKNALSKSINLNNSPLNIDRPKINNLSSKTLLQNGGKAFVPTDINYSSTKSVKPFSENEHRFINTYGNFKAEYNAKKLPMLHKSIEKAYFVNNFAEPYGSISITKSFDEPIATTGLYECVALAIVDKKEKVQTLLHFFPSTLKKYNDELLDYLLRFGNSENLEFIIVPGCYEETDNTIGVLVDKIEEKRPNANINFRYFTNENGHNIFILKDGKPFTIKESNIIKIIDNPIQDICYATIPKHILDKRIKDKVEKSINESTQ